MKIFIRFIFLVTVVLMFSSCSSDSKKIEGLTSVFTDGNLRSLVSLANQRADLSCRYYNNNGKDSAEVKVQLVLKLNYEAPFIQNLTEEEAIDQISNVTAYFSFYDSEFAKIGKGLRLNLEGEEFIKFYNFLKKGKGSTESFAFSFKNSRDADDDVKGILKTIDYFVPEGIASPLSFDLLVSLNSFSMEKEYLGESILAAYTEIWEGLLNPSQKIDPQNTKAITNRTNILLGISKELNEELLKYPKELSPEQHKRFYELEEKYTKLMKERMPDLSKNLNL